MALLSINHFIRMTGLFDNGATKLDGAIFSSLYSHVSIHYLITRVFCFSHDYWGRRLLFLRPSVLFSKSGLSSNIFYFKITYLILNYIYRNIPNICRNFKDQFYEEIMQLTIKVKKNPKVWIPFFVMLTASVIYFWRISSGTLLRISANKVTVI